MLQQPLKRKASFHTSKTLFAWALASPVLLYILCVMLVPCIWGVSISFTNRKIGQIGEWQGFANYMALLRDQNFWRAVKATLVFTLSSVVSKVVLGTLLALLLNKPVKGRSFFRSALMIPWTLPILIATLIWKWLLSDVGGVFSYWLAQLGVVKGGFSFFSTSTFAMFAVVLVNAWKGTPFVGVSVLAGLQVIPTELYEAAKIDGASGFQSFINITLPLVKHTILLSAVMTTIWTINNFEGVWLLTGGGPAGSTQVLPIYTYLTAMSNHELGRAMAVSVLSMPVLIALIQSVAKRIFGKEGAR